MIPEEMFIYDTDCTDEPMFDRGFTGHEHLYAFGLINMNGRVYDPLMSSFLSPDNYVQDQTLAGIALNWYDFEARMYDPTIGRFMQTDPKAEKYFNVSPYTYCLNNPLILTDPSGQETEEVETDDWIYDIARDEYVWDETVKGIESTPEGFEYVGPTLNDVGKHFSEVHPLRVYFNPCGF
ncbi:MAG: hypothetical protein MJZ90_04910 [Bacteroidales bacterium]|nr:hypothetical protein [Bacteroidales bacterium]